MIQFSLFQIPIRVLPWFWVTLALIGGAVRADSKDDIVKLLLFLIAGFLSILIHELGHALTAKAFGKKPEIVLEAFGGYASFSGAQTLKRSQNLAITIAGPALQILAGILIKSTSVLVVEPTVFFEYFLHTFSFISIFWALLNLLPVLPLDGGRIVEHLLGPQRMKYTLILSLITASCLAIAGYLIWQNVLFAIFMGFFALESFKALKNYR